MTRAAFNQSNAEYVDPIDDKDVVEYAGYRGLRNNVSPEMFGLEDLVTAQNVDLNDSLDIHRRRGYTAALTTAIDRDVWAPLGGAVALGVGSNALKLIQPDWSTATLRTGLTASRPLSYASLADRLFYSNGVELGIVQNGQHRTWGITPPGAFQLASGAGTLRAGRYQVVLTYLRNDGQESGAARAIVLSLASTGGLALSAIPPSVDPTVAFVVVYAAPVDGETLYRVGVIANGTTTFTVNDEAQYTTSPLVTQFLQPPPAGDFIAQWKGWLLVAHANRLYVSEPYAPELFDYRKSIPFLDRITMVAPLNNRTDGVWIGTESQVVWLDGESPEAWKPNPAAEYGAIPGTLALFDGDLMGDGSEGGNTTAFFWTTHGACICRSDGSFINVTQDRFAVPVQQHGASVVRRHGGMIQMLTTLQGAETPGNVYF